MKSVKEVNPYYNAAMNYKQLASDCFRDIRYYEKAQIAQNS